MNEMEKLQYVLFERLHRRAPGIDKLDRLWDAAVLLPLVRTPEGISVLFEERAHTLRSQPGEVCFPGGKYECEDNSFRNTAVRETCEELGLKPEDYQFYLDLRKYGSTRHAGFGLGFERCVMYLTGISNIRDVLPFPRTVGNCDL